MPIEKELKKLSDLKVGKWIPEYCLVRTENGWSLPNELTKRERLLVYEDKVKGLFPKSYYKVEFKGDLVGSGKILFKPSDSIIVDNEWFIVNSLVKSKFKETEKVYYEGYLYAFDINPIVSYEYKLSKRNSHNILKLDYVLN